MNNNLIPFCSLNTGTVITAGSNQAVYLVSALSTFSGSFGTVTIGSNQVLNSSLPIQLQSPVSGTARTLFYYIE
jgi:hypothetical protein